MIWTSAMEEGGAGERPPLLLGAFEEWNSSQEADDGLAHCEEVARGSASAVSRPRYWPGGPRIKDPTVAVPPEWGGSGRQRDGGVPQARVQEVEQEQCLQEAEQSQRLKRRFLQEVEQSQQRRLVQKRRSTARMSTRRCKPPSMRQTLFVAETSWRPSAGRTTCLCYGWRSGQALA